MLDVETLRATRTNGCNYDIATDDIIAKLQAWDTTYGIEISDIAVDAVTVHFKKIPEDTRPLAEEIYKFCPDTVSQNFGCYEEMLDSVEEMDEEVAAKIMELTDGIDFNDENYGVVLLARSLKRDKLVGLWWD